jgi:hypothetical protein
MPVVTAVVAVAPIGSVTVVAVAIPVVGAIVGTRPIPIITRSVENRDRNWKTKGKMDTSARRRFSDESQSRDDQQEDNELLHELLDDGITQFDQTE